MIQLSRRALLGAAAMLAARPRGYLVENAIHLFAADQKRFPYHKNATYRPPPLTLETYSAFAREARIDHTVIVHSEVYQDDHRYLEYAFQHEPSPGFFKGTCLFDPIDPKTPDRMQELARRLPGRIVGIRIHEMRPRGAAPTTNGPMRDRDMRSEGMKNTWRKAHDLGLIVQMQSIPCYAPQIAALASASLDTRVLIDHLGLPSRGAVAEYDDVLNLAKLPRVFMKVSSFKLEDKPLVRRVYDAFGPDRLIFGGYGASMPAFEKAIALIDQVFDFAPETERAQIRGGNAMRLFGFLTPAAASAPKK